MPAFAAEGRAGLLDFWAVYQRIEGGRTPVEAADAVSAMIELPEGARAAYGDEVMARMREARVLLGRAICDEEWEPYIAHTHALGERFAELGIAFAAWHTMVRTLHASTTAAMVATYSGDRLTAALVAAGELLDFWIAHVTEPYLEVRQRDRFRLLLDSVKDYAIYMLDPAGRVTSWTAGAEALLGYAADEILGRDYAAFFPEADRAAGKPARMLEIAASTGRHEDEGPRVRKDGRTFWADAAVTAMRTGGRLVGFAKVVRDLTERRQADAERRGLEERFRALAKATSDAIITADEHGAITYVNHAGAALFGAPVDELVGQPLTVLMPERLRDQHLHGLARYVASGEPRLMGRVIEQPALRRDGSELATEMSITTWTSGGAMSFAAIIRDVSERKAIERMLEERTHQLEVTNREVEAFSYSVAHDLRAPLRSVSGFTQILLEDFAPRLDRDAVGYLTKIQGGVTRMTALIDALLQLARLSRSELEVKLVNLAALARTVVASLAATEPSRAVEIEIDTTLRANADGRLVRTLLENLIGNAWKFTAKAAVARIEVGAINQRTYFVKDNGAGFDMAHARKLFTPFERLHAAEDFPGTGVGLATVQRIVDRHGGRIWVQSAPGQGATFFFTLSPTE